MLIKQGSKSSRIAFKASALKVKGMMAFYDSEIDVEKGISAFIHIVVGIQNIVVPGGAALLRARVSLSTAANIISITQVHVICIWETDVSWGMEINPADRK